ncbi:hypothetical protein FV232_10765 [Methylobacterium sp. WL30]|uniref:hypothetical protein n=1 Tax=unclassified Methylobacterium TaxID=2615210 RepID=UPI0011C9EB80|nr:MULTISPECIES: hypothetical protein [unclassified Methylobacterium]TXM94705.1 hypothetical protein FV223_03690 [Methylobacterium sp. WL116]TXN40804.1 hypothetical protein FV225_04705 [Methylobacterium sp. WL93]TXN50740.1 hypothetical protein FV227_10770 [Methylobacterium sp. WL119]TXN67845.1 hypothetical protein FV232_10765 [Methylobacterium sp. WL30]
MGAIAQAYAFYVQLCSNPNRAALVAELEPLSGCKRTRTTTDLHLIVERFVSYGGDTPTERLAARKLISRDVRAIQHLEATRVLPSRVQALGATTGEGLHAWARRAAAVRPARHKPTRQAAAQNRSEQRQRALVHEVTITTRRPDGTCKRRRKVTVTGALTAEIGAVQLRVNRLAQRERA